MAADVIKSASTIRRGSTGALVVTWQNIINAELASGVPIPLVWRNARGETRSWPGGALHPLKADGTFGVATEIATEAIQVRHRLEPDGVVGPLTWSALLGGPVIGREPLLYGVDLSAMQGTIGKPDWTAMRDKGVRFVIARACVGNETWIDTQAAKNLARAREHGMVGGLYFFSFPLPHIDPRTQVEQWIKRCEVAGLDLAASILALDLEWPPREEWRSINGVRTLTYPWKKWVVTAESIAEWNLVALARARELTGRSWLRYSYPYFLKCIEAARYGELAAGPLWLADYTFEGRWPTANEVGKRKAPAPWSTITIMQHDGNGGMRLPASGIDADFNVLQGGEAALARLTSSAPPNLGAIALEVPAPPLDIMPDDQIASYRLERLTSDPDPTA